ncbi:hypothetical protein LTQ03_17150 [Vibrio splendidus]|uniref:hypothetical protein n=1 Tax=Vibrio splendidus TaxID=29497 RepID=UPI001FB4D77C|nr:hypothetical protein [Vibrio splendidus]UOE82455.1 hypothetical protein LTQ03_17150 [Vibrio splendidus]
MSTRLIQDDFECLKVFVNEYRLPSEDNGEYFSNLKRTHKVYFSVLELHSVCKGIEPFKSNSDSTFVKYLGESVSELGSSLFVSLHGCYKGSDQILRSSIENFLKAIGSTVHSDITSIKNTYEVIDKSGDAEVFQTKEIKEKYHKLKGVYSTLCASVHTATELNMQNVGALGHFPYFDADSSAQFMNRYVSVSTAILDILCWSIRAEYSKVHYQSKDIIQASLSRNIKVMIYSGEASLA